MIKSFKHKGLRDFFENGTTKGIRLDQANKIRLRLAVLDSADIIEDLKLPGYNLHQLKGNKKGLWSIVVTGNWRITLQFKDGNVFIVNYEDYH